MRYSLILLLCYCVVISACKKDKEKMPEPTQEGKNVLACKVNGKVHIYDGPKSYLNDEGPIISMYSAGTETYIRVAANEVGEYEDHIEMRVYVSNVEVAKKYIFSTQDSKDWADYYLNQDNNNVYTTKNASGYIQFSRYDQSVAAGTFAYTCYNDQGDKIEITEGFFDLVPR